MLTLQAQGPEFDPQSSHLKSGRMVVHNGNTASGETKTRGSLGLLVSPFSLIGKLQANERACLKEVDYVPDDNTQSCYLAYTYTHTHTPQNS